MPKSKKPRRQHTVRRSPFSGSRIPPHIIAVAKNSKEPIPADEIDRITIGYQQAITGLMYGTLSELQFWQLIENHYLYVHILDEIRSSDVIGDETTHLMLHLEIDIAVNDAEHKTAETIDAIGQRYRHKGKFIASGDELKTLTASHEKFKAMLGIANYSHYVRAYEKTEPKLEQAARKHNRSKTECMTMESKK